MQSVNDKIMEVVGIKGAAHLARIQGNISITGGIRIGTSFLSPHPPSSLIFLTPSLLGQGSVFTLTTNRDMHMQVDGEPWLMVPATITIDFLNQVSSPSFFLFRFLFSCLLPLPHHSPCCRFLNNLLSSYIPLPPPTLLLLSSFDLLGADDVQHFS